MIIELCKIISFVLLLPLNSNIQAQKYSEYEVKAAYLEKFTRFIEWPDSIFIKNTDTLFVIGLMGDNPINSIIKKTYSSQRIKNKKVEIRNIHELNEIDDCNLLYISGPELNRIEQIRLYVKNKPVLTVCDDKKFSKRGVQFILFVEGYHVYFEIDMEAINQSGLYINSLLLKLSKSIN